MNKSIVIVFIVLMVVYVALGLPDGVLGAAWPVISDDLNINVEYIAIISNVNLIVSLISSLFYPKIIKKYSLSAILIYSVFVTIIALFLFASSKSLLLLIISSAVLGLGGGLIDTSVNDYASKRFSVGAVNVLHGTWGIGISLGSFVVGSFLLYSSVWQYAYITVAFLQVLILLFIIFSHNKLVSTDDKYEPKESTNFKTPKILYLHGLYYLSYGLEFVFVLLLSSYCVMQLNYSESHAAFVSTLFLIGITVGRFSILIIEKILSSYQILLTSLIVSFILGLLTLFMNTIDVNMFLIGFFIGPLYPTMMSHSVSIFNKKYSSKIISINVSSAMLGALVVPLVASYLFTNFSYSIVFIIFCTSILIMSVVTIYLNHIARRYS